MDTITYWIDEEGRAVNDEADMLTNFRDFLDDTYGTVSVAGIDFDTSRLLEQADPIAFREEFLAYCDGWTEVQVPAEVSDQDSDTLRDYLRTHGAPQTMTEDEL